MPTKRSTKITVTAGKNEKVNNVIPLETLLERLETGAAAETGKRRTRSVGDKQSLTEIAQLAKSLRNKLAPGSPKKKGNSASSSKSSRKR